jgi:hypothetical protein
MDISGKLPYPIFQNRGKVMSKIAYLVILCFPAVGSASPTFDQFASEIQKKNIQSVESALSLLPDELRSNFTLIYDSNGIQQATPRDPRAILFSKDGSFILSFNGDPSLAGYNTIEVLQFREVEKKFEFRDISFSEGKPAVISRANPKLCLQCHGSNPAPIWESYSLWLGAYGSEDDAFNDSLNHIEKQNFEKFRPYWRQSPRYSNLVLSSVASRYFPYSNGLGGLYDLRDEDVTFRPNLRLSLLLGRHQAQRIVENLRKSPLYEKYKALILFLGAEVPYPDCTQPHSSSCGGLTRARDIYPFSKEGQKKIRKTVYADLKKRRIDKATIKSLMDVQDEGIAEVVAVGGLDIINTLPLQKAPWFSQWFTTNGKLIQYVAGEIFNEMKREDPASTHGLYPESFQKEAEDGNIYFHNALDFAGVLDGINSPIFADYVDPKVTPPELPIKELIRKAFGLKTVL